MVLREGQVLHRLDPDPFYMRWPNGPSTINTDRYATNIDIAPTAINAAGVELTGDQVMDGTSLLDPTRRRKLLLTEDYSGFPDWVSIRNDQGQRWQYVETYTYNSTFYEFYDLETDPEQRFNKYSDPLRPQLSESPHAFLHPFGDSRVPQELQGRNLPPQPDALVSRHPTKGGPTRSAALRR